jgi:hypothetical protein
MLLLLINCVCVFGYEWSGVGTIIFSKYNNLELNPITCIMVAKEINKSKKIGFPVYEDFGGNIINNNIAKSACMELYEETAGYLKIINENVLTNPTKNGYCNHVDNLLRNHKYYRTYFLYISNLNKNFINYNYDLLHKYNKLIPIQYLECDDVRWIPLYKILEAINQDDIFFGPSLYPNIKFNKYLKVDDIDNNKIYLTERIWKAILHPNTNIYNDELAGNKIKNNRFMTGMNIIQEKINNDEPININELLNGNNDDIAMINGFKIPNLVTKIIN